MCDTLVIQMVDRDLDGEDDVIGTMFLKLPSISYFSQDELGEIVFHFTAQTPHKHLTKPHKHLTNNSQTPSQTPPSISYFCQDELGK